MIVVLLLIGAVLFVSALRNTHAGLATALETDVPGYLKWAVAVLAVGVIGFWAPLRPVSRGLLALVLVVIILGSYRNIAASLTDAATPAPAATPPATPSAVYGREAGARGGAPGYGVSPNDIGVLSLPDPGGLSLPVPGGSADQGLQSLTDAGSLLELAGLFG